ncbi:E3 ubiquitin-protein ligase Iruka isoform X1 [Homalodisca vitripennis]|uniref:E3 ubiquitin-protein ligase Iruka isoform X1 n=1 Tax=Homalodisca vitripennis TaxID=197043 RepID=UPI001EECA2A6|nr:E3 ubiquitin-protein ligase Iruka isoform X1 [Homalodisca vitripennis]
MAEEAAVENLAISRFFCHKCNLEINRVQQDYTCPTCQSGFIEVLENQPEPTEESDSDMEVVQPFDQLLNDMLMGLSGSPGGNRRGNRGNRSRGERRRGGRGRPVVPFENLIQDFIVNLTEVGLGGLGVTPRPNGPVNPLDFLAPNVTNLTPPAIIHAVFSADTGVFLGNPGDYAWGREGLDAIVTQLLNQMDGNGPPPLAQDKIQEIPTAAITQDQVDSNLQCSVCWEDFKVSEPVRKLICEHVYHEPCIIPWLELHGTCPICRMTLSEEGRSSDNGSTMFGAQSVGPSLAALFRAANDSASSRASSTSSSDTSISGNSFNSNNMDLDYD